MSQAFDRVPHDLLQPALRKCGVEEVMLDWVALCYRDISARPLVNGEIAQSIRIGRSVQQGCPLSPVLFALQLEHLCQAIIQDKSVCLPSLLFVQRETNKLELWVLRMGDQDVKLVAYADDMALICASKTQVESALRHVPLFSRASGAEINQRKSIGAQLGECATKSKNFAGIALDTKVHNYLGAPIGERGPMAEE